MLPYIMPDKSCDNPDSFAAAIAIAIAFDYCFQKGAQFCIYAAEECVQPSLTIILEKPPLNTSLAYLVNKLVN
jgi:O-succinylbenzoate synthase